LDIMTQNVGIVTPEHLLYSIDSQECRRFR
jgi:hypothetical protein